jgi:hypothetical protein
LIALFEDVTDRRSLSQELEDAKKFLELGVDNIPVSLIVERVSDGRYLLASAALKQSSTAGARTPPGLPPRTSSIRARPN